MKCVIGIDGGGTKTLLRMTDLNRNVLVEQTGGLSNICASTREVVENNLRELFRAAFEKAPSDREIVSVAIGSAGVVDRDNVLFFKDFLKQMTGCDSVIVENDAVIALYANLESEPGVSITSGTGSICCGKNRKGNFHRVGGWGHLFSDEGSAYAIAVSALSEILKSHDGRREFTLMTEKMLSFTGVKTPEELVAVVYADYRDKSMIARLSRVADIACEEGDKTARRVLDKAAMDLVHMCKAVIEKLNMQNEKLTVVLNGGVLKNCRRVKEEFTRLILDAYPKSLVTQAMKDAAWGSVYLALESLKS